MRSPQSVRQFISGGLFMRVRHDAAEEEFKGEENFDHVTIRRKQIPPRSRQFFLHETQLRQQIKNWRKNYYVWTKTFQMNLHSVRGGCASQFEVEAGRVIALN